MLRFPLTAICLSFLLLTACGEEKPNPELAPVAATTAFTIRVNDIPLQTEVVISIAEQRKGLMERDHLPTNSAMLFPYSKPQQMSFWMANTWIPLSIGFFDRDGVLREIYRMYPNDTRSVRSKRSDLQFALEVNQGWFRENAITPGAKLNLDDLRTALKARGSDPDLYLTNSGE